MIRCPLLTCVLAVLGMASNVFSAPPRVIGQWPEGPHGVIRELTADGNTLYADVGGGIVVLDVADPAKTRAIRTLGDESTRARVAGPYLSLCGANGLRLLDMQNRAAPAEISRIDGNIAAVVWTWPFAYVQDVQTGKLAIYDFTDAAHPALVGNLGADAGAPLTVSANILVTSGPDGPVQFFDITDRAHPNLAGNYAAAPENGRVLIDGNHAFVPPRVPGSQIDVLDISDLANIQKIGEWRPDNAVILRDLAIVNGKLVVEGPYNGLEILDITDLTAPKTVGRAPAGIDPALGVFAKRGNDLFVGDYSTIKQLDFGNPAAPTLKASFNFGGDSTAIRVSGNLAFLQYNRDPVKILDVSDPSLPREIPSTLPVATSIWAANQNLFLIETNRHLNIFDVSNPRQPRLRATIDPVRPERYFDAVVTSGKWAILPDINHIWYADISNLDSPVLRGDFPMPGDVWDVIPQGGTFFVLSSATSKSYMTVVNLEPVSVSTTITNAEFAFAFSVVGSTVYLLGDSSLFIWDISDPQHAAFKGKIAATGNNGIATMANFGADRLEVINQDGLVEYDVSSPFQPVVTKQLTLLPIPTWFFKPRPIAVAGGIGYVAVGDYGLVTLQLGGAAPARPAVQVFQTGETHRLRWPADYAGYILQSRPSLQGTWSMEAAGIGPIKLFNEFEEARQQDSKFYELRTTLP
jgi:hypothetical protein